MPQNDQIYSPVGESPVPNVQSLIVPQRPLLLRASRSLCSTPASLTASETAGIASPLPRGRSLTPAYPI